MTPDNQDAPGLVRGRWKRWAAEMMGTFLLTFVDAGGAVIAGWSSGAVTPAARAVAVGLVVMGMTYTLGEISGAHLNPAVTLAFALRGDLGWRRVPAYWAAEVGGALLAAALVWSMFGDVAHLGMTMPRAHTWVALVMETVLTFLLVTVVLGTATHYSVVGANAALAVGGAVALCGLFARPVSGASMNPARSLGPAIMAAIANGGTGGELEVAWIYIVGPFAGASLAVAFANLLQGARTSTERHVATGSTRRQPPRR